MARLPPKHVEKREAALRANLLKRKEQARGKAENPLPEKAAPDSVAEELAQAETKNVAAREPDRSVANPREDRKRSEVRFAGQLQTTTKEVP